MKWLVLLASVHMIAALILDHKLTGSTAYTVGQVYLAASFIMLAVQRKG